MWSQDPGVHVASEDDVGNFPVVRQRVREKELKKVLREAGMGTRF